MSALRGVGITAGISQPSAPLGGSSGSISLQDQGDESHRHLLYGNRDVDVFTGRFHGTPSVNNVSPAARAKKDSDRVHQAHSTDPSAMLWFLYLLIFLFVIALFCTCPNISEDNADEEGGGRQRQRRRRRGRQGNDDSVGDGEDEAAAAKRRNERMEVIRERIVVKKLVLSPSSNLRDDDIVIHNAAKQSNSFRLAPRPSPPQARSNNNGKEAAMEREDHSNDKKSSNVKAGGASICIEGDEDVGRDGGNGDINRSSSSEAAAVGASEANDNFNIFSPTGDEQCDADGSAEASDAGVSRGAFLSAVLDGILLGSIYLTRDDIESSNRDGNFERIIVFSDQSINAPSTAAAPSSCCGICLGDYRTGEAICWSKYNVDCVHVFHEECLVMWLMDHDDCPCCRADYLSDAGGGVSPPEGNGGGIGTSYSSSIAGGLDADDEEEEVICLRDATGEQP